MNFVTLKPSAKQDILSEIRSRKRTSAQAFMLDVCVSPVAWSGDKFQNDGEKEREKGKRDRAREMQRERERDRKNKHLMRGPDMVNLLIRL